MCDLSLVERWILARETGQGANQCGIIGEILPLYASRARRNKRMCELPSELVAKHSLTALTRVKWSGRDRPIVQRSVFVSIELTSLCIELTSDWVELTSDCSELTSD
jgi:hypothetical protein